MAVQPLPGFMHRRNPDHTHDAICLNCKTLASVAWNPKDLIKAEAKHICGVTDCDISGLSLGLRVRRLRSVMVLTYPI
jgi:hypothetical protein